MNTEFEVKYINVDHTSLRKTLLKVGAVLEHPMRLMKRVVIETPELLAKNAFLRVRDQGDKTTLTYKQFDSLSVDGAKEFEIDVSDFETTIKLLEAAGLPHISYQESKRETWLLDETEIVLDEWPWLNPYIEIEGPSEQHVREAAALLGFLWNDAVFGDVMAAYRVQYPHLTIHDGIAVVPEVRFNNPLPDLLKSSKN